jgi:hypothetical protein
VDGTGTLERDDAVDGELAAETAVVTEGSLADVESGGAEEVTEVVVVAEVEGAEGREVWTAARALGNVEGETEVTLAGRVEVGATTFVDGEPVSTLCLGASTSPDPTPEANTAASSTPANTANVRSFRRRGRTTGNPSARHESERSAEVPDNDLLNDAFSTWSRRAGDGPVSWALATMVDGFTSILRRRSQ